MRTIPVLLAALLLVHLVPASDAAAHRGGKRPAAQRERAPRAQARRAARTRPRVSASSELGRTGGRVNGTIDLEGRSTDQGLKMTVRRDAITLEGTAAGDLIAGAAPFRYREARSVAVTLDIGKAPTRDHLGRRSFAEKNSRIFQVTTNEGWSAKEVAQRLADKVNAHWAFTARVETNPNGSVTVRFERSGPPDATSSAPR
jgi:hypothetical protein